MSNETVIFAAVALAIVLNLFGLKGLYKAITFPMMILKKFDEYVCMVGSEIRFVLYFGSAFLFMKYLNVI